MSFSFSFSGEDIEGNDEDDAEIVKHVENLGISTNSAAKPISHSLSDLTSRHATTLGVVQEFMFEYVSDKSLKKLCNLPSQISYNSLVIPWGYAQQQDSQDEASSSSGNIVIQRRSLFDIRAQLMAEANPELNNNDNLLAGLEQGDLTTGIYEGGFKTWECALDLARLVGSLDLTQNWNILELGAGTAVPSLTAFQKALHWNNDHGLVGRLHFTLCDYNEDVLRLATGPNVLLNYLVHRQRVVSEGGGDANLQDEDLDIEDFDQSSANEMVESLNRQGITFHFVSGGWGHAFLDHVSPTPAKDTNTKLNHESLPNHQTLILASETIYSPESTKIFADILISILKRDKKNSKAWVAAKKVYFGVGGGIEDFSREIKIRDGNVRILEDAATSGVGRLVLEVTV